MKACLVTTFSLSSSGIFKTDGKYLLVLVNVSLTAGIYGPETCNIGNTTELVNYTDA